jgi:tetratricopeptide (TPR) repeat protein
MAACLIWLAGCAAAPKFADAGTSGTDALAADMSVKSPPPDDQAAPTETTGSLALVPVGSSPGVLGTDLFDELSLGKKQFRASNYALAEQHFRKAVEKYPNDAEAWVGLAASYDRLRRFDLADRAYKEAIRIVGRTPEILNNQGFSYMLRGEYRRSRATLKKAQELDPHNPYILNNLNLLELVARKGKGVG